MYTPDHSRHDDDTFNTESHIDELIKVIHHQHTPPFDLIVCEILDSILQHTATEHIAQFSQVHVDTVRRAHHLIESTLNSSSHSQIIYNCQIRHWSTHIHSHKTQEPHAFE